jgi:hypothetical protein
MEASAARVGASWLLALPACGTLPPPPMLGQRLLPKPLYPPPRGAHPMLAALEHKRAGLRLLRRVRALRHVGSLLLLRGARGGAAGAAASWAARAAAAAAAAAGRRGGGAVAGARTGATVSQPSSHSYPARLRHAAAAGMGLRGLRTAGVGIERGICGDVLPLDSDVTSFESICGSSGRCC